MGGAEMRALDIARKINAADKVIAAFSQTPDLEKLRNGFKELDIKYEPAFISDETQNTEVFIYRIANVIRSFISTLRILIRHNPDSVFLTMPSPNATLGTILSCALLKKKTIVRFALVPNEFNFGQIRKKILRWAKSRNQTWITLSDNNRNILINALGTPSMDIKLIYDGFCPQADKLQQYAPQCTLREELHIPGNSKLILTVGALCHQKGYDLLIPTIPHILNKHSDTYFIWAGTGDREIEYRKRLKEYNIEGHVFILGQRMDITRLMLESNLLVFPTRYEGLPAVILEAFYYRLPVVSFNTSSMPEMIIHKKSGLLARKEDPCDLQANILYALEHPDEMIDYTEHAAPMLKYFSTETMLNSYIRLLTED